MCVFLHWLTPDIRQERRRKASRAQESVWCAATDIELHQAFDRVPENCERVRRKTRRTRESAWCVGARIPP
jgi:hypothetical protein